VLRAGSYNAVWLVSGSLALAGGVLAFAVPETRRPEQQDRPRVRFLNRSALLPGSILACEMFALAALMVFSALYARQLGMAGAGLVLLTNAAVLVSIRIFGRRLPDRLGVRRATTIGVLFAAVGPAIPAIFAHPWGLYLGAAAFGIGHAFLYPALFMLAVGRASEHERSAALGTLKACEAAGFAVAAAALGVASALFGYQGAFGVAAIVTSLGFVPLLFALRRGPRSERSVPAQASPAVDDA
jgi:MFS family permease